MKLIPQCQSDIFLLSDGAQKMLAEAIALTVTPWDPTLEAKTMYLVQSERGWVLAWQR